METPTRLIFLHGAPAVGKLTVAKALAAQLPVSLVDNHVLIDFAKSVLPFGAEGFFDLVRQSRLLALRFSVIQRIPIVLFTSCYSDPEDREQLEEMEAVLSSGDGELLPVFLSCSKEIQLQRVGSKDRLERGKVTSTAGLKEFEGQWNFVPVPRPNCLSLDTGVLTPIEAALRILVHFGLVQLSSSNHP